MVRYNHAHNRLVFDSYNFSSKDMEFLMSVNYRYMACDPDTKNSAYAIVDAAGKLIDAWVVKAAGLEECAMPPSLHLPEVEEDVEVEEEQTADEQTQEMIDKEQATVAREAEEQAEVAREEQAAEDTGPVVKDTEILEDVDDEVKQKEEVIKYV